MEGTKTHWFSGAGVAGRAVDFGGVKYESVMLADFCFMQEVRCLEIKRI